MKITTQSDDFFCVQVNTDWLDSEPVETKRVDIWSPISKVKGRAATLHQILTNSASRYPDQLSMIAFRALEDGFDRDTLVIFKNKFPGTNAMCEIEIPGMRVYRSEGYKFAYRDFSPKGLQ